MATLEVTVPLVVNAGSGLLLVALGVFVARVKPRRRINAAFGVFSATFGAEFVFFNLRNALEGAEAMRTLLAVLAGLTWLVASVVLIGLLVLLARKHHVAARRTVLPVFAGAGAVFAAFMLEWRLGPLWGQGFLTAPAPLGLNIAFTSVAVGMFVVLYSSLLALAIVRLAIPDRSQAGASDLGIVAAGLAPYTALVVGTAFMDAAASWTLVSVTPVGILLAAATGWIAVSRREGGSASAVAVALVILGFMLLGMVSAAFPQGPFAAANLASVGIARTLGVAVFAYAIVRHQLLGIDVKVKWTLEKSTLAAIFVGAFFVVSEAAQEFFGGVAGSQYIGILAAGALLFALAPLQRFAHHVADRAMPGVKDVHDMDASDRRETFRRMARAAWADGVLTSDERKLLMELRESLGLSDREAEAMEREVMR